MANPNTAQGTLNRLRASLIVSEDASLNITSSYLAKEGISMSFENDAGQLIGTMTGGVTSPEPYQMVTVTARILKTQALASTYKAKIESLVNLGEITVIPDASTLSNYTLMNCILMGVNEMTFDGTQPGFILRFRGIYFTNGDMFNLA